MTDSKLDSTNSSGRGKRYVPLIPSNVMRTVKRWWGGFELADRLFIPQSKRGEIRRDFPDEMEQKRQAISYWINTDPLASWRRLITALDRMKETEVADSIRSNAEPLTDASLTPPALLHAVSTVRELWGGGRLLWFLGFPFSVSDKIRYSQSYSSEDEKRMAGLQYCLQTLPGVSWGRIAGILWSLEEHTALENVRQYLPPKHEPSLSLSNLTSTLDSLPNTLWRRFGGLMNVPPSTLNKIQSQFHTERERKTEVLCVCSTEHPQPTWEQVSDVLYQLRDGKYHSVLERVQSQFPTDEEESREQYEVAITKGYIESALALLILVGVMGSGKSEFKRLVLGLPVPEFSPSTPLAESSVRSMSICQVAADDKKPLEWRIVTINDILDKVRPHYLDNPPESANNISQSAFNSGTSHGQSDVESGEEATVAKQPPQRPLDTQKVPEPPQYSDTIEKLKNKDSTPSTTTPLSKHFADALTEINIRPNLMRRISSSTKRQKLIDIDFIYILDSGGQPPFREMLSHFVQKASAFILMQKLNERLDFKPPIKYREEGKEDSVQCKSQLTNEQILHQYFQAVQSHNSRAFVVGTHRDLEHKCEKESMEDKNQRLLEAFQPVLGNRLALYKAGDPDQLMFPVDSTSRKREDQETAAAFREAVINFCLGKKVKIPLPWFILEELLQLLAMKMNQKVFSIEECYEAARQQLRMSRDNCKAAIKFLGMLNILFYRPSVLPRVVFCDAQVILDKITELVHCSDDLKGNLHALPQNMQSGEWLKFRDFAQIDSKMLEQQFPLHYREGLFTAPQFLKLLEDLLIAGKLANGKHFIPSVLPNLSLEEVAQYRVTSAKNPSPMTIYYTINSSRIWLPVGVVPSLVVYLQNHCKWEPVLRQGYKPACMYHNCMQYQLPMGKPGSVTLINSTKFLEIHVKLNASVEVASKVCCRIRDDVVSGLKRAHKSLHYDSAVAKCGVLCSGECGNAETHLATLDESEESWRCTEDSNTGKDLEPGQTLWFPAKGSEGQDSHKLATAAPPLTTTSGTASGGGGQSNGTSRERSEGEQQKQDSNKLGMSKKERTTDGAAHSRIFDTKLDLGQLLKFKYRDDDGDLEEMEVIPMVAKRWKIFGVGGLGMKDFKVDSCKCDNDNDSCYSVFQMFLQNGSKKFREPKWSSVIQAMRDSDFNALATELEKALTRMSDN